MKFVPAARAVLAQANGVQHVLPVNGIKYEGLDVSEGDRNWNLDPQQERKPPHKRKKGTKTKVFALFIDVIIYIYAHTRFLNFLKAQTTFSFATTL